MLAVNAHYDGSQIVCDEAVDMRSGQKLIVTIVENKGDPIQEALDESETIIDDIRAGRRVPYNSWEEAKASLMK